MTTTDRSLSGEGGRDLAVLGTGLYLPRAHRARDLIVAAGGNPEQHVGWDNVCVAGDEEHPSSMGAAALEMALKRADVAAEDLDLVVYAGVSRDFSASWSVAMAIMDTLKVPGRCIGFDLTVGCLGAVVGLETAAGWLQGRSQGLAAIVCAERWSYTVDRADLATKQLWGYGDGAGAIVVGRPTHRAGQAIFLGSRYVTRSDMNGILGAKFGGTRFPVPPHGELPYLRRRHRDYPRSELRAVYRNGYRSIVAALREDYDSEPHWVACNQVGPKFVDRLGELVGVGSDRVHASGSRYGHVGTADVVIGLHQLLDQRRGPGDVYLLSSTHYAWGGGIIRVAAA